MDGERPELTDGSVGGAFPPGARVYTSESYKPQRGINAVKLSYASGRPATFFPEMYFWLTRDPQERMRIVSFPTNIERMPPGSILVLDKMCCGGETLFGKMENLLLNRYELEPLGGFKSEITPLQPDIMAELYSHQNPLVWIFRYNPQEFETRLYGVKGDK